MSAVALVYTLFGSAEAAERVARQLLDEGLIACANMFAPATSLYEWNGAVERAQEVPVLFKTAGARRGALMDRLAQLHDYDVPAILAVPVDAVLPDFGQWVADRTTK
ncbi:divalent-cation tolerance protein CutA [Sphingobium mellinum]|uniref:divalent-cation tolerance protein CutA n=1 Tax=Sphingobium mellinum TaxID=1387166 RepID=UPI0030EF44A1